MLNQSKIFCTRWKGLFKGTIDGDALNDKEYSGSIISLLENAENFIKNNSNTSWKIIGMKRVEYNDYPTEAVREAIVNAIIHRDYQIIGSEIHIDMFDDRVEITSPGGMLDGNMIQNMDITKIASIRRNKIISDIFNRLHFMDRRGSGLIRILNSYKDCVNKPTFTSDTSSFKVVLPNKSKMNINNDDDIKVNHTNENYVSDEEYFIIKIYSILPDNLKQKTYELIKKLFNKYNFKYEFKREDIEEQFNIKKSRASEIIALLLKYELIESCNSSKYIFIKNKVKK